MTVFGVKRLKLWIAVEVFGLIVGDVHVFKTPEEADKWFKGYTGLPYDKFYVDGELERTLTRTTTKPRYTRLK